MTYCTNRMKNHERTAIDDEADGADAAETGSLSALDGARVRTLTVGSFNSGEPGSEIIDAAKKNRCHEFFIGKGK